MIEEYAEGSMWSAKALWADIQRSEEKNAQMCRIDNEMIRRYTGVFYKGKEQPGEDKTKIKNVHFEWMSVVEAQILAQNPRWTTKTRRADKGQMQAIAFKHSLNRWSVEQKLQQFLSKSFVDWSIRKSVTLISIKEVPGTVNPANKKKLPYTRPSLARLTTNRYLYDSVATDEGDLRWQAHKSIYDLDRLVDSVDESEGWDIELLKTLQVNQNLQSVRGRDQNYDAACERRDIVLYEVYCPEIEIEGHDRDEGWRGAWLTFAYSSPDESKTSSKTLARRIEDGDGGLIPVCKPRPHLGPCPYIVGGQSYVPDEVEPLSQSLALEQQTRSLNVRRAVVQDQMQRYKRLLLINAKDSSLPGKIRNGSNDNVIPVKGFLKEDALAIEVGGLTDQMVKQLMLESQEHDQLSGVTDAMRGNVTGNATATENALAQGGANARLAKLRTSWYSYVGRIGAAAAEMMFYDDDFAMELGPEAADQLQTANPWLIGGKQEGELFEDLEIDVEPMSMEYKSEQSEQQRGMMILSMFETLGPAMVQSPFLNWDQLLTIVGDAIGEPSLREIPNYEMLNQMAGMMLHMQLQGAAQTGSESKKQPELSKDNFKIRNTTGKVTPTTGQSKTPSLPGRSAGNKALAGAKKGAGY